MSIADSLQKARQLLQVSATPALDAEVLLAHLLKLNRAQLYARAEQPLSEKHEAAFAQLLARRLQGEPVAYIVGYQEFWSLPIKVTRDTLIPRPETECLVESALAILPQDKPCIVADLGTGSGAIALAIAAERPHWQIIATDKMPAALAVATQNAACLHLSNIIFKTGEWCAALGDAQLDLILSNPPYINKADPYWRAQRNAYEPKTALLAEEFGLADLHTIIRQAQHSLKPGGWIILEHGYDQSAAVQVLLVRYGYKIRDIKRDLAQIARVVVAQRN